MRTHSSFLPPKMRSDTDFVLDFSPWDRTRFLAVDLDVRRSPLEKRREEKGVIFRELLMKTRRTTLARLMIVVAVVAVELAAFIVAWRGVGGDWVRGLPPTALACQIGLLCAVLSRGMWRAFWTGFVVLGCAMMATFAWGLCFPFQRSAVVDAWVSYGDFAMGLIEARPIEPLLRTDADVDVAMAVAWALPQLAAALAGGVFVCLGTLVMRRLFSVRTLDSTAAREIDVGGEIGVREIGGKSVSGKWVSELIYGDGKTNSDTDL